MTDIIERAKTVAQAEQENAAGTLGTVASRMIWELIDEIERLRAEKPVPDTNGVLK